MRNVRAVIFGVLMAGVLWLGGCAVNPVTGEQQLMLLSEQDEQQLGRQTDQSVIEQYGLYEGPALQQYLQVMGQAMGRLSHRPGLAWQFKVMDSPVVNAFAAPGGYIYVTRGLLAALNNEAELAGVLGHEIGHVTARHSARQYSNMMLASLGLGLGQGLLGDYGDALGPLLEAGAGLLFLKFSRDDEREADALGVEYASRANYDAGRMADFFITLQNQPASDGEAPARLPEFFSTHPNPVNREANVRQMAAQWQARAAGQTFRVNRDNLLAQLDGLVFGEDPRKGFREGDWFYWPQYAVRLPIPSGWLFEREGHNLQMSAPDKQGAVLVTARPGVRVEEVVAKFLESTGATVHDERRATNNGLPVRLLLSTITDGKQRAVIQSHFYQKGPDVFAFHALCSEAQYADLKGVLQSPASGFAQLTDRDKLNPRPQRISLHTVGKSTTMQQLLAERKIDRKLWPQVAWINGRRLTDGIVAGEKIKLVK